MILKVQKVKMRISPFSGAKVQKSLDICKFLCNFAAEKQNNQKKTHEKQIAEHPYHRTSNCVRGV